MDWLRTDRKYGKVQIVPVQLAAGMTLSGLILTALGAGRTVPLAVKVKYRAGLEDAAGKHPDILNLIKRLAVVEALADLFLPSGGSTSVDGLSQSFTFELDKHRSDAEGELDAIRGSLHGLRLLVA